MNYDTDNWRKLVEVLNSDDYATISELNRAQIIDDTLNLARAGYIDYEIAFNTTKYLAKETNYFSWKAFFNAVSYLSQRLDGRFEIKKLYNKHVLHLVAKTYESFNFKENTFNDTHLDQLTRELIFVHACKNGHYDCIARSKALFNSRKR